MHVAAVGDIQPPSSSSNSSATAALASRADFILGLGDYQYQGGSMSDYNAYFDRSWGPNVAKMYPVLAPTHDQNWQAGDTLNYWNGGGASGVHAPVRLQALSPYSFNRGGWHFVALPDACYRVSGCDGNAITTWLANDLSANPTPCTVAYFHQAYFTSAADHDPFDPVAPWVKVLVDHHVDILLQGHNHNYERFALQNEARGADPNGIQAFVVGTGGIGFYAFRGLAPTASPARPTPSGCSTSPSGTAATAGASPGPPAATTATAARWLVGEHGAVAATDHGVRDCRVGSPGHVGFPGLSFGDSPQLSRGSKRTIRPRVDHLSGCFSGSHHQHSQLSPQWPPSGVPIQGVATPHHCAERHSAERSRTAMLKRLSPRILNDDPRRLALAAACVLATLAVAQFLAPALTHSAVATTFTVTADSYVSESNPDAVHGDMHDLLVDGGPMERSSYLRVDIPAAHRTLTKATLRIYSTKDDPLGVTVRFVADDNWRESTITFNNARPPGTRARSLGAHRREPVGRHRRHR